MQARMKNPATVLPSTMKALMALYGAIDEGPLPKKTAELVHLRVSQINGCAVCVDLYTKKTEKGAETLQRTLAASAWRDAPFFTPAERAALALAESMTRIADRGDVPDDIWAEAARHYGEPALAQLVLHVSLVNVWNRLNVTTRQVAGAQSW